MYVWESIRLYSQLTSPVRRSASSILVSNILDSDETEIKIQIIGLI